MNDKLNEREALIKRIDDVLDWEQNMGYSNGFRANLLRDCRAALSRKYVPMTDDDFEILLKKSEVYNQFSGWEWEREIETEVTRRAGLAASE